MNVGYDHDLLSSFYLWFDDRLSYFAEAYQSSTNHTFEYVDTIDVPTDYHAYYSPYRQFMWSSDKILVNNFVNINGTTKFDKVDDIYIDYNNGRVLVDTDYGKAITKMTKHQIVSQAAVAMAGQANAIASTVSSLLEAYA